MHFLSKVFEKIVLKRLISFFSKFEIICKQQFGFLKNLSTVDAANILTENISSSFNNRKEFVSVFLYYFKAFDTVMPQILIKKLYAVGIRGTMLDWIGSYLTNRKIYVSVNGIKSKTCVTNIGVPQGSILGPLLFLIYINDMNRCMKHLSCIHYADDTSVFIEGSSLSELVPKINEDLENILKWLNLNKLSLNINKSYFMIFSNKNPDTFLDLRINGITLQPCTSIKFLGIHLDNKLNFVNHIKNLSNKISKSLGIMRKLSVFVPKPILSKIYASLVHPYLIYAVEIWGHARSAKMSKLVSIQKKCFQLFSNPNSIIKFMSLNIIIKFFSLIKFFQILYTNRSNLIKSVIFQFQVAHPYSTRFSSNRNVLCPSCNLTVRQF